MVDKDITEDIEYVFRHLGQGLDLIHEVYTVGHQLPLYGRLLTVGKEYIELEKRDGRIVTLRKTEIRSITPTYNQPPKVEGFK